MRILVTGANGFIGSRLVASLLNDNHEVRGLVRKTSNLKLLQGLPVELTYGDVAEPDTLDAAVEGVDIVIHTAGAVMDWGELDYFTKINVGGTQHIALASERAGVKRFVHISTVAVHGFDVRHATEDHPKPDSYVAVYCSTKKMAEDWLHTFIPQTSMEVSIVRPGNVFGPHDEKFIAPYLDFIEKGGFVYVNGGKQFTCPTYIENLVYGIQLAAFHPAAKGETFLITDGLDIDWRQFTDSVVSKLGLPLPRRSVPHGLVYGVAAAMEGVWKLLGKRDAPLLTRYRINNAGKDYHFSVEKARRLLGYAPPVDFQTAVERTVEWYLEYKKSAR